MTRAESVSAAWARHYLSRGWAPIPVPYGSKAPKGKNWPKLKLSEANQLRHFNGVAVNIGVLLGKPSGGLIDVDLDAGEALALAPRFLPATPCRFGRQRKPESHWLYVAEPMVITEKFPGVETRTKGDDDKAMIVELRSTGAQTIFPGSVHPSGEVVEFVGEGEPALVEGEALRLAVVHLAAASLLARHWPAHGARHEAALATAGFLLRMGLSLVNARRIVVEAARAAGDEEWQVRAADVETTAQRVAAGKPVTGAQWLVEVLAGDGAKVVAKLRRWLAVPEGVEGVETWEPEDVGEIEDKEDGRRRSEYLTDAGNARRFVHQHGARVRYCYPRKTWLVYDGRRWTRDGEGQLMQWAKRTARAIYREAAREAQEGRRRDLAAWARRSESAERLRSMLFLAQSEAGVPVGTEHLDADPWVLNVMNGTIDLRTGGLRPHRREDLITRLVRVTYDPTAPCPRWLAFLQRIMAGRDDLIAFLQRALGYALTGSDEEQCFFMLYGSGANGKSTFLRALGELLDEYAVGVAPDTLMDAERRGGAPRPDIVRLRNARFVSSVEAREGGRLAEVLVKLLTGSDPIVARGLFKDEEQFPPTFKLFLAVNHKPVIKGTDEAIWRRIHLIPFTVTVPKEERDKKLPEKLRAEWPGILAWAVKGCLAWQREGLGMPDAVAQATAAYRNEMDLLGAFLRDRCAVAEDEAVGASSLYANYRTWCEDGGEKPGSHIQFGARLAERWFQSDRFTSGPEKGKHRWLGLRLRRPGEAPIPTGSEGGDGGEAASAKVPSTPSHIETSADEDSPSSPASPPGGSRRKRTAWLGGPADG